MDKEREERIVEWMQSEIEDEEFFDYEQWDGYIEDEDEDFSDEDLEYIRENYKIVVTLVKKENENE